jgi:hypothetical protein
MTCHGPPNRFGLFGRVYTSDAPTQAGNGTRKTMPMHTGDRPGVSAVELSGH